jgi:hypothetical protein
MAPRTRSSSTGSKRFSSARDFRPLGLGARFQLCFVVRIDMGDPIPAERQAERLDFKSGHYPKLRLAAAGGATIFANIVMPTSVHLPAELLEAVDQRARALKISRNQLVVRALEREVRGGNEWSPGFFEALSSTGPELTRDVDELLSHVRHARHSKPARRL